MSSASMTTSATVTTAKSAGSSSAVKAAGRYYIQTERGRKPVAQITKDSRILIVGNDNYPRSPLTGCINDAEAWRKFFRDFENLITLHDANKQQILDGVKWLAETGGIFVYSGHGTVVRSDEPDGYSEAMCAIDFNKITDRELANVLVPTGKHVVCILDCCHSADEFRAEVDSALPVRSQGRFIALEEGDAGNLREADEGRAEAKQRRLWADSEVVILGACKSNQSAYEVVRNKQGRGAFSFAMQTVYDDILSLRGWTNKAGDYLKRTLQINKQVPKAVGKAKYLQGTLGG